MFKVIFKINPNKNLEKAMKIGFIGGANDGIVINAADGLDTYKLEWHYKAEKHCEAQPTLGLNGPEYDYYNLLILRKIKRLNSFMYSLQWEKMISRVKSMSIGSALHLLAMISMIKKIFINNLKF